MNASTTILFLGDIIGKPGRKVVTQYLESVKNSGHAVDLVIANVENTAHGFGITEQNLQELEDIGIQVFTGGNHTFDRKEIFDFIGNHKTLLRPANYPEGTAGVGSCLVTVGATKVGIINLIGRVFMEPLMSPFLVADKLVAELSKETKLIFVDFHAEATAEKIALGLYLAGRVSAVIGTHTHVQTADERILPGGTAFITDAGCCGPTGGVIGMDRQAVFRRMIEQLPARFEVAAGPAAVCGIKVTIDNATGKATSISRVHFAEKEAAVAES